jgi:predicted glycosyltransferase
MDAGHKVIITSRKKDIALYLLDYYGFKHINLGIAGSGFFKLSIELVVRTCKLLKVIRREKPDIMIAVAGTFIAPAGKLTRIPVIIFYDTEQASISNAIAYPLAKAIVTPSAYSKPIKRNHVTYDGYQELAYLAPKYFSPDPSILELLGVKKDEKYVIVRFVSWGAGHDIGHKGITLDNKRKAVEEFSKYAKVFISSEAELSEDLQRFEMDIPFNKVHDALYYASLLYGESATMASECAVLGTPAIYLDNDGRGYTDEQEEKYGAVFNFTESLEDQRKSISKGIELLKKANIKQLWAEKRSRILADKIDVTDFIVNLIGNYPDSINKYIMHYHY